MSDLPNYPTTVKRAGREVAVTLEAQVDADRERVFDFVAAEGVLPEVLTGYTRFLPAVVGTSGNTGPWDTPGSSRTVHLKGGSTAREEVTAYDRPAYFAYKTSDYTFALRHIAMGATGQWWFTPEGPATQVRWTYTFKGKGWLRARVLTVFARRLWSGYMAVCVANTQRHFLRGGAS